MITTFSQWQVDPFNIQKDDISIEDIAHHLACTNRFNGALRMPVNVAQHCYYVSKLLQGTPHELQALLHDGAEAYVGDMVKPLKDLPEMEIFRRVEDQIQQKVYERFGCALEMHPLVEEADRLMVRIEAHYSGFNLSYAQADNPLYGIPTAAELELVGPWEPWLWYPARRLFLQRFSSLYHEV